MSSPCICEAIFSTRNYILGDEATQFLTSLNNHFYGKETIVIEGVFVLNQKNLFVSFSRIE